VGTEVAGALAAAFSSRNMQKPAATRQQPKAEDNQQPETSNSLERTTVAFSSR